MITNKTQLVGLLGASLGHSVSPAMHNRVYREMGLDYLYLPVEVSAENLPLVFNAMKKMNFAGCNVTIPYKEAIIPLLDEVDPVAAKIGAVNTVQFADGKARGFNTDGSGFLCSLQEEGGITVCEKRVLILGSGGAARAIAMTLAAEKAAHITLCNRTSAKAAALAAEINSKVHPCADFISTERMEMEKSAREADLLVNATSIGMLPEITALPCPKSCISPHHIVADIVYNPHQTALLQEARKRGAKVVHGCGMLVWQGVEAFTLFTGKKPAASIMKKEVQRALRKSGV